MDKGFGGYGGIQGSLGAAGGNAYALPVKDASEIDQRMNQLDSALDELRQLAAGLQVKLQSVLVPKMANDAKGPPEAPRPVASPMADRLDKLHSEFRHTSSILRDIFERIAL